MGDCLNYPEQLALWRTVPLTLVTPDGRTLEPRGFRKDWCVGISVVRAFKPGIRLTEQGRRCSYNRKTHNLVAVGPALAIMLDRPELAALVGGDGLQDLRSSWEYQRNAQAVRQMKSVNEARLGYEYETLAVTYHSNEDESHFRIRAGQRCRALAAIEKVLSPEDFADIYQICFSREDNGTFCDLAADHQYWE